MALTMLGAALSRLTLRTSAKSTHLPSLCLLHNKPSSVSSTLLASTSLSTAPSAVLTPPSRRHLLYPAGPRSKHQPHLPASLRQMHRSGPIKKKRKNKNPLVDRPFARGVVLKTLIKKPKKPNSANRKCVLVRLTTGRELLAFVPGEGHNLQEHNIVLVQPGRLRDTPGVKLRCIRGKHDLQHVIKKQH
ncbi:40S ribosomal protein S12, mitochondrial [Chionoecetes opilio]|uniref:Small ribosomal subunit protein uS12m n=1 Tax=Chionoecetes opilio TaxID=41210 RepID=A0A8J5D385_CHIOP|nr:40S ribosomal protein S12, mitochondrial [Chionoecetes opilio]